jgi:hypothetical protein
MKSFYALRIRALLFAAACLAAANANAADAYHEYVADIYLLQSEQTRNPETIFAYADGKNGALLKSVLSPSRFTPPLNTYFQAVARGGEKNLPNVVQAIKPVIDRYDAAFKANPKKYETEYLDSLEYGVLILLGSSKIMAEAPRQTVPEGATPDQKKMAEAADKMRENVKNMSAAVTRNLAESLRQRAEKGEFSAEGAKRAVALANKLAPAK